MLDNLPDHIILQIFINLSLRDRLQVEMVSQRYHDLIYTLWRQKREIIVPDDLRVIDNKFTFSSFWDNFGQGMTAIIRHCPNIKKLYFKQFRRLQIFLQAPAFLYFTQFTNDELSVEEVHFGKLFVTDRNVFETMATAFPSLKILTIDEPYPLIYPIRHDTIPYLESRIVKLRPGLDELLQDNNRVTEDFRYLLQLFPRLEKLTIKSFEFVVLPPV